MMGRVFGRALRISVLVLIVACIGLVCIGTDSMVVRDVRSRSATPAAPPEPMAKPVHRPTAGAAELLEVRVIDDDGAPVEGATVERHRDGAWDAAPAATAVADADGHASRTLDLRDHAPAPEPLQVVAQRWE